uniref:Uncharacterized protein n=1 Tax=Panagrolaimus sp. JU765 TaxID=591449 RepID=A0AC34RT13_9BILA
MDFSPKLKEIRRKKVVSETNGSSLNSRKFVVVVYEEGSNYCVYVAVEDGHERTTEAATRAEALEIAQKVCTALQFLEQPPTVDDEPSIRSSSPTEWEELQPGPAFPKSNKPSNATRIDGMQQHFNERTSNSARFVGFQPQYNVGRCDATEFEGMHRNNRESSNTARFNEFQPHYDYERSNEREIDEPQRQFVRDPISIRDQTGPLSNDPTAKLADTLAKVVTTMQQSHEDQGRRWEKMFISIQNNQIGLQKTMVAEQEKNRNFMQEMTTQNSKTQMQTTQMLADMNIRSLENATAQQNRFLEHQQGVLAIENDKRERDEKSRFEKNEREARERREHELKMEEIRNRPKEKGFWETIIRDLLNPEC